MDAAKGSLFVHAREYIVAHEGEPAWVHLLSTLPPGDRAIAGGLVLAGGWYSLGAFNRLVDGYFALRGANGLRDVATYIATQDMNVIFTMILKMSSPEFVMKRAPSIYQRYFAVGTLTAEAHDPRKWRLALTAPLDVDEGPSQALCSLAIPAWVVKAVLLTGAKSARVDHEACRFRGVAQCEYTVAW